MLKLKNHLLNKKKFTNIGSNKKDKKDKYLQKSYIVQMIVS